MANLIFFGSDQYSEIVISALITSQKFAKITIITDRAKPKDREQLIEPNPVEKLAITHHLKICYYPPNLSELSTIIDTDTVGLCTSFDHLVPSVIIELFHGELYNLHPSLLPQYRNVAPIQYAIALGDQETGITLFKITTGIDNGEIVGQVAERILPDDTTPTLSKRLFVKGADMFLSDQKPTRSDLAGAPLVFTRRLTRDSGHLDWAVLQKLLANQKVANEDTDNLLLQLRLSRGSSDSGTSILHDLLRALTPWPGIWTVAPTKKGEIRVSIESILPKLTVKLAGKPNPVSWSDFVTYYL